MVEFYLFFVCAVIVLLLNVFVFKRKSMWIRFFLSVGAVAVCFLVLLGVMAVLWNMSTDPREAAHEADAMSKYIELTNNKKERVKVAISYKYLNELDKVYNNVADTFELDSGKNNIELITLPIDIDSTTFVKDFNLTILDSLNRTLSEYNDKQFLEKCSVSTDGLKPKNKLLATYWYLKIED